MFTSAKLAAAAHDFLWLPRRGAALIEVKPQESPKHIA
jgi:hypothetical protein